MYLNVRYVWTYGGGGGQLLCAKESQHTVYNRFYTSQKEVLIFNTLKIKLTRRNFSQIDISIEYVSDWIGHSAGISLAEIQLECERMSLNYKIYW